MHLQTVAMLELQGVEFSAVFHLSKRGLVDLWPTPERTEPCSNGSRQLVRSAK